MGSKRRLAPWIVDYIKEQHPEAKHFYDLFGGGGAISFYAMNHFKKVHYNELNTGVCELLKRLQTKGVTKKMYKWVSREQFHKHKDDPTWYGGYVALCWSFGNNGNGYLYSKANEELKKPLHKKIVKGTPLKDIQAKRLVVKIEYKKHGRMDIQHLERVQNLEHVQNIGTLDITNLSYEEVKVKGNSVIYLDPPYANTAKYKHSISHDDLLAWIKEQKVPVYLSSYEFDGLECVGERGHRSSLSAIAKNKVTEKLFRWLPDARK